MHKLKIGQIFRYPIDKVRDKSEIDGYANFSFYTDLPNQKLVKLDSGINPIGKVVNKIIDRTPAILTRSSLHKTGSLITPWEDFYNIDKGHIRFFGDNKVGDNKVIEDPEKKKGNKALLKQFEIHNSNDINVRKLACPIIFFKSKQKGYLEFNGFGIITNAERIVQHNRKTKEDFVNYVFDFAVLEMTLENEYFDWEWINLRRGKNLSIEETLKKAPSSWKKWIRLGNKSIDSLRRNVFKLNVLPTSKQKPKEGSKELKTLKEIYDFYDKNKLRFENLASIVTGYLIKKSAKNYKAGWITKGSGDSGIDFIGRMDIGTGFGSAKVIVLGQAKCESLNSPTGGNHIARTVAKLKRGWLGVYVTTSYFSDPVQIEILEDKYPLLLINGKKLAELVNEIVIEKRYKNVTEYLEKVNSEYEGLIQYRDPEEILLE